MPKLKPLVNGRKLPDFGKLGRASKSRLQSSGALDISAHKSASSPKSGKLTWRVRELPPVSSFCGQKASVNELLWPTSPCKVYLDPILEVRNL